MSPFRSPRNYSAKKSSNAHEDYLPIFEERQVNPSTSINGRWSYCLKNLGTRTLRCQVSGVSLIFGLKNNAFKKIPWEKIPWKNSQAFTKKIPWKNPKDSWQRSMKMHRIDSQKILRKKITKNPKNP